ncbi:MAG: RcpC/CpaB family pilus assembly protein [Candidatus Nanopelagicales bacterium]
MARKIILVVASLTLVIAGAALYLTVSKPAVSASDSTTVYVAAGDLGPGTRAATLTDTRVQRVQVASNLVPPNALTNISQVINLQTSVPIFKGQILMTRMFSTTATTGGLSIPPGTNAVTIQLSDGGRVAGFVQPGSKVVVYQAGADAGTVVLQSADVIAVGPTTATGKAGDGTVSNKAVDTTLITFALTPRDSVKVVGKEGLYLGLLPS